MNATNNDNGWTAGIGAALEGHSEITKVLLDNGANVNDKDEKCSSRTRISLMR